MASVKLVERHPGWWGWRTWCAGDLRSPLGPPEQFESPDQRLDQPEQDEEGHAQVHAVDATEAAHNALQVILGNRLYVFDGESMVVDDDFAQQCLRARIGRLLCSTPRLCMTHNICSSSQWLVHPSEPVFP